MNRYRAYGPSDDQPLTEGDNTLLGIDGYSNPENLPPGVGQAATNTDFTSADGVTRGGFVCIPELATEAVGLTWHTQASAANNNWYSVAYGNGIYVAVGNSGAGNRVMTSPDGEVWTSRTSAANSNWLDVTFGNNLFVAVCSDGSGQNVATSPDGITWTLRTTPDQAWVAVTYGNGKFVAISQGAVVSDAMYSSDGLSWSIGASTPSGTWTGITYGNGVYVAVGNGVAMTSSDGSAWTARTPANSNQWTDVAYGEGKFVAVAMSGAGERVMISEDSGVTWAEVAVDTLQWNSIAYGNGMFIAVAGNGDATGSRAMSSFDGYDWIRRESNDANAWQGVGFGAGLFVAVSTSGTGDRVMTFGNMVWASNIYSDPNDAGSQWIMLVSRDQVGFYAFGNTSHTVNIVAGQTVTEQSTVVQCNNLVYIFRGDSETPLYWDGNWSNEFQLAPTPTPLTGFEIIPNSNQATFYQNRLWVKNGKDRIAASDVLDFAAFDELANDFNLNTGDSNFVVTTYPFGDNALIVFKNRSILVLQNVEGSLADVTVTEVTRQVGAIGINSVVSVGPDLVYVSDRNINLLSLTTTNNAVQHKILPLSTPIKKIFDRVNWDAASKISMGYWDNKLYVALPLDNAESCSTVCVYNFVTEKWYGEWSFDDALGIAIQGWAVADYLGLQRLHAVSEDGRIFVTDEGPQDISGNSLFEISSSYTSRAYRMNNESRINRRMWVDLATWRPNFTVESFVDGVSEGGTILTDQTYLRSQSWIFNDATYLLNNSNDDYNRAGRKDYAGYPEDSIQAQSGFLPEARQAFRYPILTRRKGRLTWFTVSNSQGVIAINGIGGEARAGDRSSLVQVI